MIDTARGTRYVGILAIVSLCALLLAPFFFWRYVATIRLTITDSLEPARQASTDVQLALAREVSAVRGFLLTAQPGLLAEYRVGHEAEVNALRRLSAVGGLDSAIRSRAHDLGASTGAWNALNHRLAGGTIKAAYFIDRLPDQQARYSAALDDSERLDREITKSLLAVRARIGDVERWWAAVSAALALVAAATGSLVLLSLRASLRQRTLARTDPLTGLFNRRGFAELAQRELRRADRYGSTITVASFDVDGFKAINDGRGHAAGDRLLQNVGEALRAAIRDVDVAARLGGDEFAVLLSDNTADPPERAIERVRDVIMEQLLRAKWPVTLSIGAVTAGDGTLDIDGLIREADALMYQVTGAGKNSIRHRSLGVDPARATQRRP